MYAQKSTPEEIAFSQFIQGAWARFAKDPYSGPGWTAVGGSSTGHDLGNLGSAGPGMTVIRPEDVDGRCGLFNHLYLGNAGITP